MVEEQTKGEYETQLGEEQVTVLDQYTPPQTVGCRMCQRNAPTPSCRPPQLPWSHSQCPLWGRTC